MNIRSEKTPDQIRRETVPVKHTGIIYGFLAGILCGLLWFGGWALFHPEQIRRYPSYVLYSVKSSVGDLSLFRAWQRPEPGMNAGKLRYLLLRYGNLDHRLDAEIIKHGWYPKGESPAPWVFENGAVAPVYSDSPLMVFKWPTAFSLLTFLWTVIWGLVSDYGYRLRIISGIPFDGSIVATVGEYKKEVKGSGMRYGVRDRKDR